MVLHWLWCEKAYSIQCTVLVLGVWRSLMVTVTVTVTGTGTGMESLEEEPHYPVTSALNRFRAGQSLPRYPHNPLHLFAIWFLPLLWPTTLQTYRPLQFPVSTGLSTIRHIFHLIPYYFYYLTEQSIDRKLTILEICQKLAGIRDSGLGSDSCFQGPICTYT